MKTEDGKKIPVRRSNGHVQELSAEQLEELNYQRKVRDQSSTGHLVTPRQVNIFAIVVCMIVVLFYALPRIIWQTDEEQSTYVPLSDRIAEAPLPSSESNQEPATVSIQNDDPPSTETVDNEAIERPSLEETATAIEEQTMEPEQTAVISDVIQRWASDWSAQDIQGYLSHYSTRFVSDTGMNIEQWRDYRTGRVAKPTWIQVLLVDIEIEFVSDILARVQFTQNYSASNFQEISKKQLRLEANADGWQIVSEVSLD